MRLCKFIIFSIVAAGLLNSCTRKSDADKTSLSIAIPETMSSQSSKSSFGSDVSAMTLDLGLEHLIVTISVNGSTLAMKSWDIKDGTAVPASFSFDDMATGSNRLIQVIAVYSGDSGMKFMYGDSLKNFAKAVENVTINLEFLGAASGLEGTIKGRYLTSVNSGPTGVVEVRIKPEGKPSMAIQKSQIVAGWFEFFALADVDFEYWVGNQLLWGQAMSLQDFQTSDQHVLSIAKPEYYYTDYGNTDRKLSDASLDHYGFWGPGVSSLHYMCYKAENMEPLPYYYLNDNTSDMSTLDVDTNSGYNVDYTAGSVNSVPVLRRLNNSGLDDSNAACVDVNNIKMNYDIIGNQGMPLAPPFQITNYEMGSYAGTTLSYDFLDGAEDEISEVYLYGVNSDYEQEYHLSGDNYDCEKIRVAGSGQARLLGQNSVNDASTSQTMSVPDIEIADFTNGYQVIFCSQLDNGQMLGGVSYNVPGITDAGSVSAYRIDASAAINAGGCKTIYVDLIDSNSNYVANSTGSDIDFDISLTNGNIYTSCGGSSLGSSATLAVPDGDSFALVYIVPNGGVGADLTVTVSDPNSMIASNTDTLRIKDSGDFTTIEFENYYSVKSQTPSCQYWGLHAVDDDGYVDSAASVTNVSLTADSGTTFYDDSGCTNQVTQVNLTAGTAALWIKTIGSPGARSMNISATWSSVVYDYAHHFTLLPDSVATKIAINKNINYYQNSNACIGVQFQAQNDSGSPVSITETVTITSTLDNAGSGTFYTDAGCSTPAPLNGSDVEVDFVSQSSYQLYYLIENDTNSQVTYTIDATYLNSDYWNYVSGITDFQAGPVWVRNYLTGNDTYIAVADGCMQLNLELANVNTVTGGSLMTNRSTATMQFEILVEHDLGQAFNDPTHMNIYPDSSCTTPINSWSAGSAIPPVNMTITPNASSSFTQVYVKSSSGSSETYRFLINKIVAPGIQLSIDELELDFNP